MPNRPQFLVLNAVRKQLVAYEVEHPEEIDSVNGGGESKLHIGEFESERHPDLSVYKQEPPTINNRELWQMWVPELVIEVVSPNSGKRDYDQKPE